MNKPATPESVHSSEWLGLLPEREGQPDVLTMAQPHEAEAGHWYSPAAVRKMLAAERERLAAHLRKAANQMVGEEGVAVEWAADEILRA